MTGRGVGGLDANGQPVRVVFSAEDCSTWLRDFADKVQLVELTGEEFMDALDKAQSQGVTGARIYDYQHALAASKAGAEEVLTRNTKHFEGLTGKVKVVRP